jgi:hypothetical protein
VRWSWLAVAVIALAAAALVRFNLRRRRARLCAQRVPEPLIQRVIHAIDAAAGSDGVTLLRPAPSAKSVSSKLGGVPLLPDTVPWNEQAVLLLQVLVESSALPSAWRNRRITVFLYERSVKLIVRSDPAGLAVTPASARGRRLLREVPLSPVRVPRAASAAGESDESPSPYDPRSLLHAVPELASLLADAGDAPQRILPYLLVPGIDTFEISTPHVVLVGGEPELIQSEHDARCPRCAAPMRFLLQFGDVFGRELRFGDAGVGYVYGCDAHPDEALGFVDSH